VFYLFLFIIIRVHAAVQGCGGPGSPAPSTIHTTTPNPAASILNFEHAHQAVVHLGNARQAKAQPPPAKLRRSFWRLCFCIMLPVLALLGVGIGVLAAFVF
jgi:hypothetical protein